ADPDRAVGEPSLNAALKRRMDRANDGILLPEVNIALRSAIVSDPAAGKSFPIVPDLNPDGEPGDVIDPKEDDGADLEAHLNACAAAWETLLPGVASDVGILALNVRRFVRPGGVPVSLLGIARSGGYNDLGGRKIAMIDPAFTQWNGSEGKALEWGDEIESIFAHEAAHSWPIAVESTGSAGTFVQGLH